MALMLKGWQVLSCSLNVGAWISLSPAVCAPSETDEWQTCRGGRAGARTCAWG
eukprot:CAMPEP_0174360302 /NCGR_PEP_ID=MMETSP0811_2-20130205/53437_1 /TAXON_ID=73025 ORGANISM="Eutreptiella gymnastica-like, Strain CCMP1594" /NCGR_SAMPLE_ID=MMETSP0811_2 /ASSEMBLY_ACC=CAM_ASM_000667 /LENGTH=52 /DNA_ID=CAMNT_0015495889 /DNA_START=79 /DNA_END=233 /DNA_ORIENTATION=+